MKKFLHDLIERKETQIAEIRTQIETSKSLEEVRSLGSQIEALNGEITELRTQLSALDEPQGDTKTFGSFTQGQTGEQREEMTESTLEYRNAFMEYVCRGTEIPQELRANAVTTTANASAAGPALSASRAPGGAPPAPAPPFRSPARRPAPALPRPCASAPAPPLAP